MKIRLVTLVIMVGMLLPGAWSRTAAQDDQPITGKIDTETPFIRYPINVTGDGSTIVADILPVSGDLDTLLYLLDNQDQIVAENDDRAKGDPSSLIVFPQAEAGQYTLIATRYKVVEGDSSGDFELTISLVKGSTPAVYQTSPEDIAAAGFPVLEPRAKRSWTVLVYYGGDNNLEPGILNDLNEFEIAGGSNDDTNIIALVDRNPGFTDSNGDWSTVRLFDVAADVSADQETTFPPTIDTPPLADLGELDTGDGQTFAQFLAWGVRHYPAEHYAVAFGSHGAGWQGLITDDTSDKNILSLPEIQQALGLVIAEAGVEKFDLLINDACLMSSVEYFAAVAPFFHYALASPEIVIDPALDMTEMMQLIEAGVAADDLDLGSLGTALVDTYITRDILKRDSSDVAYLTHSVTNLDEYDLVTPAINNFAQIINRSPAVYSTLIGEARANTYTYSSFVGGKNKIDLGNFMRGIIKLSTDSRLINAAQDVLTALDTVRVYGNAGETVFSRTSYYNIYFPDSSKDFKQEYFEQSPLTLWGRMIRNYYNSVTPQVWTGGGLELGFHLPVAPKISITNIYPPEEISLLTQVNLYLEIIGRQISYGDFTVDQIQPDGSAIRFTMERILTDVLVDNQRERENRWNSGVQLIQHWWDVTLPVVSDGSSRYNELLTFTEEVAFLDGRYREAGSEEWNDVGVIFDFNADYTGGKVQRIVNHNPNTDALAVIDIAPGSEFQAYGAVVSPDGRVVSQPGNTYVWPEGGLTWEWQPAPNGSYNLGFLLTAFGGTTGFDSVQVTINNDVVDQTLRADTWLDLGIVLPFPIDWSFSGLAEDEFLVRTSSPDQTSNITVYFVPRSGPDLAVIANGLVDNYGRTLEGETTPLEVAGAPAAELRYSYQTDAGTWQGHGFALYQATVGPGVGMIFAVETLDGSTADEQALFDLLRDNLVLIDLEAFAANGSGEWDVIRRDLEDGSATIYVPMPLAWGEDAAEGDWLRYSAGADPTSPTFFAYALMPTQLASAREEVDRLTAEVAQAGTDSFSITRHRTYYGQHHTWEAAIYQAVRGGQAVTGRVYTTLVDGVTYVLWIETPNTPEAAGIFDNTLEPIVDGYRVEIQTES
ncbi:MAG: hypothetical protein HY866_05670 [Chloroflexi bacterium]|nr:hypothetical protein [Chloroflexota bacterium]